MAATEDSEDFDESMMVYLPEGVKPGQMKQALEAKEMIWRLADEKKTLSEIANRARVPARAVEWVILERPKEGPEGTGGGATPRGRGACRGGTPPNTEGFSSPTHARRRRGALA